jgi:hypothetical protein
LLQNPLIPREKKKARLTENDNKTKSQKSNSEAACVACPVVNAYQMLARRRAQPGCCVASVELGDD